MTTETAWVKERHSEYPRVIIIAKRTPHYVWENLGLKYNGRPNHQRHDPADVFATRADCIDSMIEDQGGVVARAMRDLDRAREHLRTLEALRAEDAS